MIKYLLAATSLSLVASVQAAPPEICVTNELDGNLITADLALAIGNCHLARATVEAEGVSALEYAHSWFQQAQTLGSGGARQELDAVEQKLAQVAHAHD